MLLKEIRLKMKLGQQALGKKVGVRGTQIFNWENGYASPTPENYTKLIEVLGETPDDIQPGHHGFPLKQ